MIWEYAKRLAVGLYVAGMVAVFVVAFFFLALQLAGLVVN